MKRARLPLRGRTPTTVLAVSAPAFAVLTLLVGLRLGTTYRAPTVHGAVVAPGDRSSGRAVVVVASSDLEDGVEMPRPRRAIVVNGMATTTDNAGLAAVVVATTDAREIPLEIRSEHGGILFEGGVVVPPPAPLEPAWISLRTQQNSQLVVTLLEGPLVIGQQMLARVTGPEATQIANRELFKDDSRGVTVDARAACADGSTVLAVTATFTTAQLALGTVVSADVPVRSGVPAFGADRTLLVGRPTSVVVDGLPSDRRLWLAEFAGAGLQDLRPADGDEKASGRVTFAVEASPGEKPRSFQALRSIDGLALPVANPLPAFTPRLFAPGSEAGLCARAALLPERASVLLRTTPFSGAPVLEAARRQTRNRGLSLGTIALLLAALVEVLVFLESARENAARLKNLENSEGSEGAASPVGASSPAGAALAILPGLLVVVLGCLFVIALLWN